MKKFPMLHALMAINDVTADDLKEVTGHKHRNSITRKINGDRNFKLDEAKAIADYFDMTVDEVFFSNPVTDSLQKTS